MLTPLSWDYLSVEEGGEITMLLAQAQPDGAHAVCVVGYELRNRVPGGGEFIVRNSWGEKRVRRQRRSGGGHGTLFFNYVSQYCLEAFG